MHNAYGYGLFTGGLGAHYGAERLGAMVIPVSGGDTKRQIMVMKDFGVPGALLHAFLRLNLAEVAEGRRGPAGGRRRLLRGRALDRTDAANRDPVGLKALDIYGLSEIIGPGVAIECSSRTACTSSRTTSYPRSSTRDRGAAARRPGGELVLTTLTKEALPVIRYRTRDITRVIPERAAAARTCASAITGRSDDMLIIRGVNVFPSQIETVLVGLPDLAPHYQLVVGRRGNMDELAVEVEAAPSLPAGEAAYRQLAEQVRYQIKSLIGVTTDVTVKKPGEVPRSQGKAVRVRDQRPKLG